MNSAHRVAVIQAAPVAFDVARTLEKTGDLAADANRRGARLTLFPEAFVSAYPRGLGFGAAVGSRSAEGREQFRMYWESALDVPDYPVEYTTPFGDDPETVLSRGGSCIIGPLGTVLAGPDFEGDTILTADIDRDDIARARLDFDAVGHYARPDVFRLIVDESRRTPVAFQAVASSAPASDRDTDQ